jgi:hypothetical protein
MFSFIKKMIVLFIATFASTFAWTGETDGYTQVAPQFIPVKSFSPRFLVEHSPIKLAQLNFDQPKIPMENMVGRLTKQSVEDFFADFAEEKGLLKANISGRDAMRTCIAVNIPTVQTYAAQFIADITIAPPCVVDGKNNHWFLKAVSNNHIGEIKNLLFLNNNRGIFSRLPIDIDIVIPEYFFAYYKEPPERHYIFPENEGVPAYKLKTDRNYFYLVKAADGVSLDSLFEQKRYTTLAAALREFAKALAAIHQHFMAKDSVPETFNPQKIVELYQTITHGDAHWGNIFFDESTGKISFIDNETFLRSFEKGSIIAHEMEKLLFYSTRRFGQCDAIIYNKEQCVTAINANIFFLREYIANYPPEQQQALRDYLLNVVPKLNELGPINRTSHQEAITLWNQNILLLTAPSK